MVLFTLLGLSALFLRDRKNGNNTHSGQHENVDQSDDLPPLERDDGQTSRDISSDPVVLPTTEEPITGDSQVDDDWSQDQSLEGPIIGYTQDGDDWIEYLSLEEPSIDDPQDGDDWIEYLSLEEPSIDDPQDGDDWSQDQLLEEPIIGYTQDGDGWIEYQSLEVPVIDDPQDDDDSSEFQLLEVPVIDDPQDGDDWSQDQSLEEPIIGYTQDGDGWIEYQSLEVPVIDDPQDDDDSSEFQLLEVTVIDDPQDNDDSSEFQLLEVPVIDDPQDDDDWSEFQLLEVPVIDDPRDGDDWSQDQSLEEPIIGYTQDGDGWIEYQSLEVPVIDDPQDDDDWSEFQLLEVPVINDPQDGDDWSQDQSLEEPIIGYTQDGDGWIEYQSLEVPVIDDPQDDDDSSEYLSLEELSIGDPQDDDDPSEFLSLEEPIIDDPQDGDDRWDDYTPPEDTVVPQLSEEQDIKGTIIEINSKSYKIGNQLGQGGFATVFEATRLEDDVQVAVKFASNDFAEYVRVVRYSRPIPKEVALHILANKPIVPQIIQLLDWQDQDDQYLMVLERPMPCQPLDDFFENYQGLMDAEDLARVVMRQAALAAQICCQRGVFHRDIKLQNLLINPDTLEVKLIDFGCGAFLNRTGYISYAGTKEYHPPEYMKDGRYHGEPATVWSLGIVLFVILFCDFPWSSDLDLIQDDSWTKDGLSQECCDFIRSCLRLDPKNRIKLEDVLLHDWFKINEVENNDEKIMEINSKSYKIGNQLGEGGFATVFEATRLEDDVQVAVKFASIEKTEYVYGDVRYSRPIPKEVALHIQANKPRVPQIIQLLDWQDQDDQYLMVLERPMPCQPLDDFVENYQGLMDEEDLARVVMRQAALAAQICCQRGVFHRDIKLQNLLINPDTLEVKLIDFGSSTFLNREGYTSFAGTKEYSPLEYAIDGKYHGEPATVWSLGIVLFEMLFWNCPRSSDLDKIFKENIVTKDGLSQECCDFICSCLRLDPKKRIKLEDVLLHDWFKINEVENNSETIMGQSGTISRLTITGNCPSSSKPPDLK